MAVDPARGPDSVYRAFEARSRDDQAPGHQAVVDDLAPVVDVVDELVERTDALGQPALDRAPLGAGDHTGDEVERKWPIADRAVVGCHLEGDSLLDEDRVA